MIRIFIISIFLISLCSYNYSGKNHLSNNDGRVLWCSSIKLKWEDFKGLPDTLSKYKAMTFSKIYLKHELFDDRIVLDIPCYFNCLLSWSKNKKSDNLLAHEQLHFDITELAARKIRKECSQYISYDLSLSSKFVQKTYDYYNAHYRDSINAKYDMETDHGIITSKQREWELKIAKELTALDTYSSTHVKIKRVKEN